MPRAPRSGAATTDGALLTTPLPGGGALRAHGSSPQQGAPRGARGRLGLPPSPSPSPGRSFQSSAAAVERAEGGGWVEGRMDEWVDGRSLAQVPQSKTWGCLRCKR